MKLLCVGVVDRKRYSFPSDPILLESQFMRNSALASCLGVVTYADVVLVSIDESDFDTFLEQICHLSRPSRPREITLSAVVGEDPV